MESSSSSSSTTLCYIVTERSPPCVSGFLQFSTCSLFFFSFSVFFFYRCTKGLYWKALHFRHEVQNSVTPKKKRGKKDQKRDLCWCGKMDEMASLCCFFFVFTYVQGQTTPTMYPSFFSCLSVLQVCLSATDSTIILVERQLVYFCLFFFSKFLFRYFLSYSVSFFKWALRCSLFGLYAFLWLSIYSFFFFQAGKFSVFLWDWYQQRCTLAFERVKSTWK